MSYALRVKILDIIDGDDNSTMAGNKPAAHQSNAREGGMGTACSPTNPDDFCMNDLARLALLFILFCLKQQ